MRDTICRDCIFAVYSNNINGQIMSYVDGKTQIDCELNLLDKYKKKTKTEKETEDDTTYYRIVDRICIGCRNKDWESKLTTTKEEQLKKELDVTVTYLVYLDDNHNLDDLELTIRSINSLSKMPDLCIFIDNSKHHNVKLSVFNRALKNLQTKWKVSINTEPLSTIEKCIDAVANNITGIYFSVYSAGKPVYDTVELYHMLRVQLEQIVMFEPDELNEGLTVLTSAYFAYGQNKDHSIISKIKNQAEISKCPNLVRPVSVLLSQ